MADGETVEVMTHIMIVRTSSGWYGRLPSQPDVTVGPCDSWASAIAQVAVEANTRGCFKSPAERGL